MDLSRSEYPALLECLQPGQAVAVADERIKLIAKVNLDIAEWLSDRRRIEEAYVQGLKKLVSRRPQETNLEFGVFRAPWHSIVSSTESLAQSHATLAQRIEIDVERPLREYTNQNREMQAMITIQGNLATVGKDLESAQKKVDKLKGGKSSAKKVANATSDVESAGQQWDSQAPYVFERLQAVDENRVNHLRDVLTQLQTHEIDLIEKTRGAAEGCLNQLLSVNTSDEISTFVAKASSGRPTIARQKSRTATNSMLALPAPPRPHDDGASEISSVSAGASRSGFSPAPEQRRTPFGGLKRLGTVMSRRRQTQKPVELPTSPEKRSRSNLNPLRRGRTMQSIPSPEASVVKLPSFPPRRESVPQQPTVSPPVETSRLPSEQRRMTDEQNGDTILPAPARSSSFPAINGIQTYQGQVKPQEKNPTTPPGKSTEIQRDADGFTIPPLANDEISRAQQEAGQSESEPQFKLDIRNEPIREEDGEAQSAFSNVADTLRAQAQQTATPRKPTANRGRRDVRNTVFVPSPQAPEITGLGDLPMPSGSPFSPVTSTPLSPEIGHTSDARSIRSSHSMSSMMNLTIKHPEMHQPGLNASIVETVSAWYSQSQVTRAVVMGELALIHNRDGATSTSSSENIRLENFPVLEKVAPNPSFINQMPSRSGEYSVALSQIPRTTVAFKYQVHLEDSNLAAHAPLALQPSWKVEPTQASVILNYFFNPSFVSPLKRSVTLKNLAVFITVDNTKSLSCQSKPVGVFHKDKSTIYWKLGDVTLDGYASAPKKLLARFATASEATPGSVEVRWEISGDDAVGLGSGLSLSRQLSSGSSSSDPFSDEGAAGSGAGEWKDVVMTRKVVSGKYVAN